MAGGGGLYLSGGTSTVTDTTIEANRATTGYAHGGGLYATRGAIVTVIGGTISQNEARIDGGGICVEAGIDVISMVSVDLTGVLLSGNRAGGSGGGALSRLSRYSTGIRLTNCTVTGNIAMEMGGGIAGAGFVSETTITGNTAGIAGGGLYVPEDPSWQTNLLTANALTIQASTIAGNTAIDGGGVYVRWGRVLIFASAVTGNWGGGIDVINTNIFDPTDPGSPPGPGPDLRTRVRIESSDLRNNTEFGVRVSRGSLVDLGQIGSGNYFTGLGISLGRNDFSSYVPGGNAYAIGNFNTSAGSGATTAPPDVLAQNNLFFSASPAQIEQVIHDDTDDPALAEVIVGPTFSLVFEAESDLYHRIGQTTADGVEASVAADGPGYLTFGPYTTGVPQGTHIATYRLLVDNTTADNRPVLVIDVFNATDFRTVSQRVITRGEFVAPHQFQEFRLEFAVGADDVGDQLEFRTYWLDVSYVRQDNVFVRLTRFEAEGADSFHQIGRAAAFAGTSGWSANVAEDPAGFLTFGPYTTVVPAGDHIASFRLLVDNISADNRLVAAIDVYDAFTGTVLAWRLISRGEFRQPLVFQDFDLAFTSAGASRLEFRVYWLDVSFLIHDFTAVRASIAGAPLYADQPAAALIGVPLVTASEVATIAAAISRQMPATLPVARLDDMAYAVADLPGRKIGWYDAGARTLTVDINAAGNGWFVDVSPLSDTEFRADRHGVLRAVEPHAAGMDLYSVVLHELGHALGLKDLDAENNQLMASTLAPGVRRDLDDLFAEPELLAGALA